MSPDPLRDLWLEWLEGDYDGPDLLRRVRLAVHGPLTAPAETQRSSSQATDQMKKGEVPEPGYGNAMEVAAWKAGWTARMKKELT